MEPTKELHLAVLIDADNVPYSNIKGMMEEIAKYGTPTFKRIYGDWTKPTLTGWKTVLLENAITPIQQYSYTQGKNSSDSALIIDAMDILYTGRVDGFCIVSSDSDFTRLATRLREAGMKVFGIGERKTPSPFISSCDKFIYIEILKKEAPQPPKPALPASRARPGAGGRAAPAAGKGRGQVAARQGATTVQETGSSREAAAGREVESAREAEAAREAESTRQADTIRKIDNGLVKLIANSSNDLAGQVGWTCRGERCTLFLNKKTASYPRSYPFNYHD